VAGLAAAGAGLGVYAADQPEVQRVEVALPRLPEVFQDFTIALMGDFHYDPHFSATAIAAAVRIVNDLRPDLIALAGDFVTTPLFGGRHHSVIIKELDPCVQLLGQLRARQGVFAILGNHDEYFNAARVVGALQSAGIRVLRNERLPIERERSRFWLAGINDVLMGNPDPGRALRGAASGETTVLLCHEPDFADEVARFPVDLQLSAHSHGGQIRVPLVGPLYLPPLARKYPWGLRRVGDMMLYTNCGIGTIRLPIRWNCPPEITLISLRRQK